MHVLLRSSLRSKRFRAAKEKTRNESQRPRARFISRAAKTKNPISLSFFAPKPNLVNVNARQVKVPKFDASRKLFFVFSSVFPLKFIFFVVIVVLFCFFI